MNMLVGVSARLLRSWSVVNLRLGFSGCTTYHHLSLDYCNCSCNCNRLICFYVVSVCVKLFVSKLLSCVCRVVVLMSHKRSVHKLFMIDYCSTEFNLSAKLKVHLSLVSTCIPVAGWSRVYFFTLLLYCVVYIWTEYLAQLFHNMIWRS